MAEIPSGSFFSKVIAENHNEKIVPGRYVFSRTASGASYRVCSFMAFGYGVSDPPADVLAFRIPHGM